MDKSHPEAAAQVEDLPLLPDDVPVTMPTIPLRLTISTEQQFKALSDLARSRILGVIQYQPMTAKQIASRLQATPGAIGHHVRVLEEAGLIQVVARRLTRGIVASYYTRSARIFDYNVPPEVSGFSHGLDMIEKARAEKTDSAVSYEPDLFLGDAFPHVRLSRQRALEFQKRIFALVDELVEEPIDPHGEVYGAFFTIFKSPPYMQVSENAEPVSPASEKEKL